MGARGQSVNDYTGMGYADNPTTTKRVCGHADNPSMTTREWGSLGQPYNDYTGMWPRR